MLTFRPPPPATYRPHLPLQRCNHRSTLRFGVIPGHGSSAPAAGQHIRPRVATNRYEFSWISMAKSTSVARGFIQHEEIYFGETFAPTVSSYFVRLLSAIACELDLDAYHFNVEKAFVQSNLDEDVFLRLPEGCGRLYGTIVRLNTSLYRLKQASRSWHAHLTTCLKTLGFQQCLSDACVFRLVEEGRVAIIAVVHVDDIFAVDL